MAENLPQKPTDPYAKVWEVTKPDVVYKVLATGAPPL